MKGLSGLLCFLLLIWQTTSQQFSGKRGEKKGYNLQIPLNENNVRVLEGGDFTIINSVLSEMNLPLELAVANKNIEYTLLIINIYLVAEIGRRGSCRNIAFQEGGDVLLSGEFTDQQRLVNGTFYEEYVLEVDVSGVSFTCDIPLLVTIFSIGGGFPDEEATLAPTGSGDDVDVEEGDSSSGFLTFETLNARVNQKLNLYSPDFQTTVPLIAEVGDCIADKGDVNYTGVELLSLLGLIDLTSVVLDEVRGDPNLVGNEIDTVLCELGTDLGAEVRDLIVDNDLTNLTSDFYVADPFVEGLALDLERELPDRFPDVRLYDWTDRDEFFVDLLLPLPSANGDKPILYEVFDVLYPQENTSYDSLLWFLSEEFDLGIENTNGVVIDFNLLSVLEGDFFATSEEIESGEFVPEPVEFEFDFVIEEALTINVSIVIDELLLNISASDEYVLPNLEAIGGQTLQIPRLNLGNISLGALASVRVVAENTGLTTSTVLLEDNPFSFIIDEQFFANLDWDGFVSRLALLVAADVDFFNDINLGTIYDEVFDCLLATTVLTPRLTGLTVNHTEVAVGLGGFVDALLVLVADAANSIIPVYQPIIPRALELLADENFRNVEIIEPTECLPADIAFDNIDEYPYNFGEGIFLNISDALDAETVTDLLEFVEFENGGLDIITPGSGLELDITLPELEGYELDLNISLDSLVLAGITPPTLHALKVFGVLEDSPYVPQELTTYIDIGNSSNPVILRATLQITTPEPRNVGGTLNPPPVEFYVQQNFIELEIRVDNVYLLLDLYLKYTEYAVDSVELDQLLNLDCWVRKLLYPGGVTEFIGILTDLSVNVNCDCNNNLINSVADALNGPENWAELQDFLQDVVDGVKPLLTGLFREEDFDETIENSRRICLEQTTDNVNFTSFLEETEEDIVGLLYYLSLLGLAILIPALSAFCMRFFGPTFRELKEEKVSNEEKLLAENIHYREPLWRNSLVSKPVRIAIPALILVNFALFLIGDTGDAVIINIFGQVLGIPLNFDGFFSLSVITTAITLWITGAYVLAMLLFIVSIGWPYMKLALLLFSWFSTPNMIGVEKRGVLLEWLDILGRYSFAEFHFLVFILIVFYIDGGSPNPGWLGDEELLQFTLDIQPQVSLFTFGLAVVWSIVMSNVMLVINSHIEQKTRIRNRKQKLENLESLKKKAGITTHEIDEDKFQFRLTEWDFNVRSDAHNVDHKDGKYNYTFRVKPIALAAISVSVVITIILLAYAATSKTLHVEITGIVGFLIEWADNDKKYDLSVIDLLVNILDIYKGNIIIIFVAVVFILTIVVFPLLQTLVLLTMLSKKFNLTEARNVYEAHHLLTVWCCIDVFVIAITLTVLELPTVAKGLVSAIEECDTLGQIMEEYLLPLGLIDEADAEASCVGIHSEITIGGYLCILVVLSLNFANLFVGKLFHYFILDREKLVEIRIEDLDDASVDFSQQVGIKPYHKKLAELGFIVIEDRSSRAQRQVNDKEQLMAANPAFIDEDDDYSEEKVPAKVAIQPVRKQVVKKRKEEEARLQRRDAQREYDVLMDPRERLSRQLRTFFERIDPERVFAVEQLADEAMSRPDGLYRLNQKLMDKYGTTISLEF